MIYLYASVVHYSAFSFFMGKADKAASEADTAAIAKINLTTMAIVSISYGVVAFLCTYVAQEPMKMFVNSLPEVITHGLEVAGGILPVVGFGMLLRVMMKTKYTPYFIAGFLMASFCDMPNLLPVIEVDGGIKVAVQTEFFDKIFPNFLPMCVTLLCFWLLKKKQVSPIVLIVAIIVLSIAAAAIGLL